MCTPKYIIVYFLYEIHKTTHKYTSVNYVLFIKILTLCNFQML